jgi:hypothetical protein
VIKYFRFAELKEILTTFDLAVLAQISFTDA